MKNRMMLAAVGMVCMCVFGGWLVCGCSAGKSEQAAALQEVDVAAPLVRDVKLTRFYPGYLAAVNSVDLVARVSGTLVSTAYKAGERVKSGQTLFVIEPTHYSNSLQQAEATLRSAEAQLEYARNNYSRLKEALLSNAVSEIEVIQAEMNVKECEAAVNNARAAVSTARTNLGYCTVKAPFDGAVTMCEYSVGAYLNGESSPTMLATIYDDSSMYAYFNVADNLWLAMMLADKSSDSSSDGSSDKSLNKSSGKSSEKSSENLSGNVFGDILPGEIIVEPGGGDASYTAALNYISPAIDLNTGTITLRAALGNEERRLKSGQYVGINLPYAEQKGALLVDAASIATDQLGSYMYVVNNSGVVSYRHIVPGQLVDDTLRIVTAGLKGDDRYVTKALLKVRDGMKVKPIL